MEEPTIEAKIEVVKREMETWKNTRYQQELRHRIGEKLGQPKPVLEKYQNEMVKCEMALDILAEELTLLQKAVADDKFIVEQNRDSGPQ